MENLIQKNFYPIKYREAVILVNPKLFNGVNLLSSLLLSLLLLPRDQEVFDKS
jgi:hypothetical protein